MFVKELLDQVREQGTSDFRVFTDVHPDFVDRCMQEIRVIDVNQQTLTLFGASASDWKRPCEEQIYSCTSEKKRTTRQ